MSHEPPRLPLFESRANKQSSQWVSACADASTSRMDKGFLRSIQDVLDKSRGNYAVMAKTLAALIDTIDYTLWIASPALAETRGRGTRRYQRSPEALCGARSAARRPAEV
ncbi:hypothetical protein MN608_05642 [Microdochium nivale]|nr:hypothetical protein MN608_05642 [Microdochium nivale]